MTWFGWVCLLFVVAIVCGTALSIAQSLLEHKRRMEELRKWDQDEADEALQ